MTVTVSKFEPHHWDTNLHILTVETKDTVLFRLHARIGSWDVQTNDHCVLAGGNADGLDHAKLQARGALAAILSCALMELEL